jgi:hypothetical protein
MSDNIPPIPPDGGTPPPPPAPVPIPAEGWSESDRTGPAWEQPGPVFERFAQTAQAALLSPTAFFRTMRRTGGLGAPIVFGVTGVVIGGVVAALYQFMLATFGAGLHGPQAAREQAFISLFSTGCVVVVLPVMAVISMFVSAAIYHVMLLLLGGARWGFEATMRVAAYASGSTALLNLIPLCGGVIGAVWAIVLAIIGLAQAHEISTGKAAAAVLLPMVICCVLVLLFYATILAVILGGALGGLGHR